MARDEIITGLKNAVERGERLESAMRVMINSGYASREVQEASKFVGVGVLTMEKPKPEEELVMPEKKKGFFSKVFKGKKKPKIVEKEKIEALPPLEEEPELPEPEEESPKPEQEEPSKPEEKSAEPKPEKGKTTSKPFHLKQAIAQPQKLTEQQKVKPKTSRLKIIMLLVVLLVLVGGLIITFIIL